MSPHYPSPLTYFFASSFFETQQQKRKKKKKEKIRGCGKRRGVSERAQSKRRHKTHALAVRASNLPTMRQKMVIAATRGDSVEKNAVGAGARFGFSPASLVFVAAASKENEATVHGADASSSTSTVLRAEKWPLGHGGVRIFYYASNEEESEGEDADDNAVESSIVAGDDERKEEKEEEKNILEEH